MKKIHRTMLLVLVVLLATAGMARAAVANYRTHLNGDHEVPPAGVVIETNAQGQATFQLSPDGQTLSYKLIVANIENVFQAHIHIGPPGVNGPIAVWLYPSTAPVPGPVAQGKIQGPIATGTITSDNLVNQSVTGITTLEQLIAAMEAGNAYVNVHTNDGVAPANTGPGDFPGGEIRGPLGDHQH